MFPFIPWANYLETLTLQVSLFARFLAVMIDHLVHHFLQARAGSPAQLFPSTGGITEQRFHFQQGGNNAGRYALRPAPVSVRRPTSSRPSPSHCSGPHPKACVDSSIKRRTVSCRPVAITKSSGFSAATFATAFLRNRGRGPSRAVHPDFPYIGILPAPHQFLPSRV